MLERTAPARTDRQGEAPPPTVSGASLFFDFDGTLVDLAPTPDAVIVAPALIAALERLARHVPDRLAIVSGRSIATLDDMLGSITARIAIVGSHGAERRLPDDRHWAAPIPAGLDDAVAALRRYADTHDLLFEPKPLGAAIHYRHRPDAGAGARDAAYAIAADSAGLLIQEGKMMVELRGAGHDKGTAIAHLLALPAMAGTRPLFFGDDVTDEDGFVVAAQAGGAGVLVGEPRDTAARYRLPTVSAVRDWIDRAIAANEIDTA